jgi:oligopeptidase B
VGTPAAIDPIYEEQDSSFTLSLERTRDAKFIFCTSLRGDTTEVRALSCANPEAGFTLLVPRKAGHEYYPDHRNGYFYFITNLEAKNYRIVRAPVATPGTEHWQNFLPYESDKRTEQIELFAEHAVIIQKKNGRRQLSVYDFKTQAVRPIQLPVEPNYVAFYGTSTSERPHFLYQYQSYSKPNAIFSYDFERHESQLVKQLKLAGEYDPDDYVTELVYATGKEGVQIPISLFYRKSLKRNEPQPVFMTGYGAYGVDRAVTFTSHKLTLVDRGVIYAIAHVRGGGEIGDSWHEQGRRGNKMNSFTDFIACAEHLIKERYTTTAQLVIHGKSAGGLLVGAVLNMRPELFRAAILEMPFVDVINTMSDPTLPMTTTDYAEWGNPAREEEYRWMRSYSPYDNIKPQAYPRMLVKIAMNDKNVPYWEGAKYVAKLRATKTDNNLLILHTLFNGNHQGPGNRYAAMEELAYEYAFILKAIGIDIDSSRPVISP